LQNDKEIVLEAIKEDLEAVEFFSKELIDQILNILKQKN